MKIQQINSVLDVYSLQEGLRKWKVIRMLDFVSTGQKSTNFVVFFREKNQKHSKFSLSNLTLFDIVNSHFETSNLSRHLKIVGDSDPNFLITDLLVMLNELTIFIHCHSEINRGLQSDTESNKVIQSKNCFASKCLQEKNSTIMSFFSAKRVKNTRNSN